MARCSHKKADGTACKGLAMPGLVTCWAHDPGQADARHRAASKGGKTGGRGRPVQEIADLKKLLDELVKGVQSGAVEIAVAYAVNALLSTKLRAVELERKLKETEELEQRIAALESVTGRQDTGGPQWAN